MNNRYDQSHSPISHPSNKIVELCQKTNEENSKIDKATITIQKYLRGYLVRKLFFIQSLQPSQLTSEKTFVIGNDPIMPIELDKYKEPNEKIALIACSGMRAVSLALTLGNSQNLPKIFLVDSSKKSIGFWESMKDITCDDNKSKTPTLFFENLQLLLNTRQDLYNPIPDKFFEYFTATHQYPNQNIHQYFFNLVQQYGYDYMRAVISHASIIKQSWANADTFIKIKNILSYLGINKIYMYSSNIGSCLAEPEEMNQFLKNIKQLRPSLSIHTNLCVTHRIPEKVCLINRKNMKNIKYRLFPFTDCTNDNLLSQINMKGLIEVKRNH